MGKKRVVIVTPEQKRAAENHAVCLDYLKQIKEFLPTIMDSFEEIYKELEGEKESKWFEKDREEVRHECWRRWSDLRDIADRAKYFVEEIKKKKTRNKI